MGPLANITSPAEALQLPHDEPAERAVLGAAILHGDAKPLRQVRDYLYLHRHLSIYGGIGVDANYASAEVLQAAGLSPGEIASLLELRESRPLRPEDLGSNRMLGQSSLIRVTAGGSGIAYTLWSRATLRNGRARRGVGALVVRSETIGAPPIRIVRWYDTEF